MNLIRKLRRELNITQAGLARRVGTTQPQIKRLELGERKLTKEWAEKIAPHLGVTPLQLLFPDEESAPVLVRENSPYLVQSEDYITFDVLSVEASAGIGSFTSDHIEVIDQVRVLKGWARKAFGNNLKYIRVITASGDSMYPTFNDDDILFVDETVKEYCGEGVYIIATPELRAKRLQRLIDGSMRIISDNSVLYPPEIVKGDDLNLFYICGKVVATWSFNKI